MLGGLQLAVLVLCMVLFVSMGMGGCHLSRNKMLFFSGVVFISLTIGVHLTPHLPSVSDFVSTVSSVIEFNSRASCLSLLHEVVWDVKPSDSSENNDTLTYAKSWGWARSAPVIDCEFQKLSRMEASSLLNGSWVVIAGDSQARLTTLMLLNLVLDSERMKSIRGDLFKRHSNYQILIHETGMKLDFIWAPYATNLTKLMVEFKENRSYPDVLVMGSGLWHMLHFTNASDFLVSLESLRSSVLSMVPISPDLGSRRRGPAAVSVPFRYPHLFWLGMPTLINSMLNTQEKREKMTDKLRGAYDKALLRSRLVLKSGGPLLLLDIESLSWNCGVKCTVDGMHYDDPVYDAAVHIMLNALLIQSHQRL